MPGARDSERERERRAQRYFFERVALGEPCANCGRKPFRVRDTQAHHTIRQQTLRRAARRLGIEEWRLVWDERVGLPLCPDCHSGQTSGLARVPAENLRPANEAFAAEYELTDELHREHPPSGASSLQGDSDLPRSRG